MKEHKNDVFSITSFNACGYASYKELHSFAEPQCLSCDKDKDNYCINKPEKIIAFHRLIHGIL